MPVPPDIDLSLSECAAIDSALEADPDLAAELAMIARKLRPDAREIFWRAFAEEVGKTERPATAVLAALERAATRSA